MPKSNQKIMSGFSLIEVLLVLAVISILATVVYTAAAGQRKRAKVAAAASSVKSAMTIAVACFSLDGEVIAPSVGSIGGGIICNTGDEFSGKPVWPALVNDCFYCGKSGENVQFRCSGTCGTGDESYCNFKTTQCSLRS
ncbi:MAG: type II secretion system protein [Actinomycetota bacterium]|nr:type II secretion system protein [Actinomycetota bacterium]